MIFGRRNNTSILVVIGCFFFSPAVFAVLFEPGAGVGVEFTDNATLADDKVNDIIAVTYVGGRLSEDEGALNYDVTASSNNTTYTQGGFPERRYLNLGASANWEVVKERFNWFLSNNFSQRTIIALNSNTPDNLQDSNVFALGANARFLLSARQKFSLTPTYSQYYFKTSKTNSKQYALSANWNYQIFRLTNVGLSLSVRNIDYIDIDVFGRSPDDTLFKNVALVISGQRLRSSFSINLGATNVERDNGRETTGFAGFLNWSADVSSRSRFDVLFSSNLADASRGATSSGSVGGSDVQIVADVIRTSIVNLAYSRDDLPLSTHISMRYNKITYSDNPLDRLVKDAALEFTYPVTQLLLGGVYMNYNWRKQLDTNRLDKRSTLGTNLKYNFSRKVRGSLDIKYQEKNSNVPSQNYNAFSIFVSLVYGFGNVSRPSSVGGL